MRLQTIWQTLTGAIVSSALIGAASIIGLDGVRVPTAAAAAGALPAGPTAETAWAAEEAIARAMQDNDAAAIERSLADDWAVVNTRGTVDEGKEIFPSGIKSGFLTRKTFVLSEPRVRIYGDMAVVTAKVQLSGKFQGKPFDVMERQTDVLHWQRGGWKSVLTHETKIEGAQ
jgi:ketosteroid isomerase-like protein